MNTKSIRKEETKSFKFMGSGINYLEKYYKESINQLT